MPSLDLKEYGPDLIFAELRDENAGPGCEKFHGDARMVRHILMGRITRRKMKIEDIVSDNPNLFERILKTCPVDEKVSQEAYKKVIGALSEEVRRDNAFLDLDIPEIPLTRQSV
ncbi:MAG: hypothetical protein PHH16_02635 [Candidatus Gracilibacteria bacterium]|nr:hypothetical protein [Candidatus Gracilibacteria bacterium]